MRPGESNPDVPSAVLGSALSCLLTLQSELSGQGTEAQLGTGHSTAVSLCKAGCTKSCLGLPISERRQHNQKRRSQERSDIQKRHVFQCRADR